MEKRKKIGILGGNFNPVHYGHLMIADQVTQYLKLDKVLFMPENIPPHVDGKTTIAAEHRLKMLELALDGNSKFDLELLEIERGGKSYSFDSLSTLKSLHPDCDYYFIIGSDMVDYLPKWYKIDELTKLVKFVAVKRTANVKASSYPVIWVATPLLPISSTQIREQIKKGLSPRYLLPDSVLTYIVKQKLYLKNDDFDMQKD
ncbi:nicotinate-nucleotide adenylyltransferase [Lactovum miscens]|uniref:Probable nicotinate-nucleotide adenylyltransferase n=1 Tax=Lactovum miscens TaxID=190387 RepID=A0A841CBH4_9LACT|nr:nicotinate-nucleotide adenylyltransferase [Lactovum miscens]MBB5888739.1 nicotinate-nucleotide adenylyltransferase [Lactovum miscens]